jgi:hypothetical protein
VVIAASAPTTEGGIVHAVTVIQPVQTWTVIRGQNDFVTMENSLASYLTGVPPCPKITNAGTGGVENLVESRNQLQQWLINVLLFPGARESPAIRFFLTDAANIIPPQYENVPWTMFAANGQVATPPPAPAPAYSEPPAPAPAAPAPGAEFTMDDMIMEDEDMFGASEAAATAQHEEIDDEEEYRPSLRYQPTDEPISAEDEMDIAQMAGEVEMIEDVGSLAQSLGASHLGRSLMLQEETPGGGGFQHFGKHQNQDGLQFGNAVYGGRGGIGNAMENAPSSLGGSFNPTMPESAPRLDAFKMIKVIGKGSFGTLGKWSTLVCSSAAS